ncbi:hypothetical protein Glove_66g162 [Diversispora epigaea]|uniref:Uncharacterized protein n=1 Tax=Diversispora epigaea TaxID=1348612 RepID=A0A397JAJ2_9GLOM|nr:hypothetical protein Glove_66g162 [Diversispora epigaea]
MALTFGVEKTVFIKKFRHSFFTTIIELIFHQTTTLIVMIMYDIGDGCDDNFTSPFSGCDDDASFESTEQNNVHLSRKRKRKYYEIEDNDLNGQITMLKRGLMNLKRRKKKKIQTFDKD